MFCVPGKGNICECRYANMHFSVKNGAPHVQENNFHFDKGFLLE